MQKFYYATALCVLSLFLCQPVLAQDKKKSDPFAPGENIYKHYVGTIGNRPVALDLVYGYQGASNYGGSRYYYTDSPGVYHFFIKEPPTFNHDEILHGYVVPEDNPFTNEDESLRGGGDINLEFRLSGRKLTGTWADDPNNLTKAIDLSEEYVRSYSLEPVVQWDWTSVNAPGGQKLVADIFSIGVKPGPLANITETDFINKQLLKFGPDAGIQAEYIADYYKAYNKNYLKRSVERLQDLIKYGSIDQSRIGSSYYTRSVEMLPLYNDEGFLVIRNNVTGDSARTTYLNLDVKGTKNLALSDIMKVNPRILSYMLETELRKKYYLGNSGKLSTWLNTDIIPVSKQFMLSHKGIVFIYPKGSLHNEREIQIYQPYEQLWGMLKPEFRERLRKKW